MSQEAPLVRKNARGSITSRINRKGRMLILSHRDELVRQPEKYFNCTFGIEKADEQASETVK